MYLPAEVDQDRVAFGVGRCGQNGMADALGISCPYTYDKKGNNGNGLNNCAERIVLGFSY